MRDILGEDGCCYDGNERIIAFVERRRKYIAKNNMRKRVLKYRVDGKMITTGRKCDFGLAVYENPPTKNSLYLIELKGSSFGDAVEQIIETISTIKTKIEELNVKVYTRIIIGHAPTPNLRNNNSKFRQLENEIKRRQGNVIVRTRIFEEPI